MATYKHKIKISIVMAFFALLVIFGPVNGVTVKELNHNNYVGDNLDVSYHKTKNRWHGRQTYWV